MTNLIKNGFDSIPQLENDNTVHHLGLRKGDGKGGCILTSNLERIELIKDTFIEPKKIGDRREYITYTGKVYDTEISTMTIGNGCMPTEIAVEELRHIDCKRMIKVGSCYSIDPNIKPGTIFVPTGACRCEGATLEYVNIEYPAVTDLDTFFAILNAAKELNIDVTTGIIRTHDALFLESPFAHDGVKQRIAPWQKVGVSCVDNECATLLTVASILGLQAACVYVVTDNLETNEVLDFESEYESKIMDTINIAELAITNLIKGERI